MQHPFIIFANFLCTVINFIVYFKFFDVLYYDIASLLLLFILVVGF